MLPLVIAAFIAALMAPSAFGLGLIPVNLLPPSISGSAQQGQTLTCSPGIWANSPTGYSYTWQRDLSNIGGATSSTYTVQNSDVGHSITCSVVASNASGSSLLPAVSAPVVVGLPAVGAPVDLLPPSISGSAQQGQTLGCSTGTWLNSPTGYAYTWQRTGSKIGGATSSTYTLTSSDVNQLITCTVVARNANGNSLPAVSLPVVPLALPPTLIPILSSLPTILGTPQVGQKLTCSPGTWLNSPTSYAYTWQRDATNISGATSRSYTVTSSDVNQLVTCTVVASNLLGSSAPAVSQPVVPTTGSGGTQGTNGQAPVVSSFSLTPRKILERKKGHRLRTKGARFTYRVNQAATVLITIQRRLKSGRYVKVGQLAAKKVAAGLHGLKWTVRVHGRLLAAGRYRAIIAASNANGSSHTRSLTFRVLRRRG